MGIIRLRVVALIIHNNSVLIVEHTINNESWWCFPGGRQEFGEKQTDAIMRELKEELNIQIFPIRLLYIAEFMPKNGQATEFYWLCECRNTEFEITKCDKAVTNTRWVSLDDLQNLDVLPEMVKEKVIRDSNNFPIHSKYLGVFGE